MDDRHLEAFAVVAEELSFRRAAERLYLSPSPLSRHIRELEAELGTPLFERDTRHVRLTAAGKTLLPLALDVLSRMANAARSVGRAAGQKPEMVIGMRALSVAFHRLFADTIRSAAPWPVRVLPIESTIQRQQLLRGALDIGVQFHEPDSRLSAWPILHETLAMALPDEPRFRKVRTVAPEHIAGLQVLTLSGKESPISRTPAGSGPYCEMAAGVVPGADLVPGGIASLIADGTHCAFIMADPQSPWHQSISGTGVVIRRLPASFPKLLTSAVWLTSRTSDDDIAPVVAALKVSFPKPTQRSTPGRHS